MTALGRYRHDSSGDETLRRIDIWKWGVGGAALGAIGSSILMVRGGWHTASTVGENVTFVAVNAFVGTVLGLLAGWFAALKQRDLRKPTWWW